MKIQTEAEIPAEPEIPLIETDRRYLAEVKTGDNLTVLFKQAGLSPRDVFLITNSRSEAPILNNLRPGYTLVFDINDTGRLASLEVITTPLESYLFTLDEQSKYGMEHIQREPDVIQTFKQATIEDSLFMAATKGGISAPITMELADIFSGVIDFILDTRSGDTFTVLYEEKFLNGKFIGNGAILAAQFSNQGETYTALRYQNKQGDWAYYNTDGESMKKAFLRNPIDIVRISSNFSLARKHPILNTIRAHKGTDYAAPRGTPVQATSDGRVVYAARNGSFGKLVVLQHGERFQTKYAHLSDYAKGIKAGARVRQGQVIGYVGTTGSATGPHLHYEFLMDGVHRNYRTIHDKLPKAEAIAANEMQGFREQTQILLAHLDSFSQNPSLAQINSPKKE
ncbi:MAG: peptidoglycan DD-metalloendopeptidase family protein [Pseudomonadales bacterium]|nr:peptidoglycan DD-metalloendopeptidase family protein [Pseudomonadales bacterium]